MLKEQPWIHFGADLDIEWRQEKDEGRRVDDFQEICARIKALPCPAQNERLAENVWERMKHAAVEEGYPYEEPSDLPGIRSQRPPQIHRFEAGACSKEYLRNKLAGAWLGRIAGCLLGKPVEGFRRAALVRLLTATGNFPLWRYITADGFTPVLIEELKLNPESFWADNIHGAEPADDDTNYTVFALKLLEVCGREFTSEDVMEGWLNWIPMLATCTAERAAYRNACAGLLPPQTASYRNPYREWIGAQIRGDIYGYINPGEPEKAAEFAFRDASISHVKNGVYGEMFVAAMLAAAAVCDDVRTVVEAGLQEIPAKSRLYRNIGAVLVWHAQGVSCDETVERIHRQFDEADPHGWCHVIPNAMIVTAALLYGGKDFGKTVCLAVQAAFDTDCNGATAGSVVGMMAGETGIPVEWVAPYNSRLQTSIIGYNEVDVAELTERTLHLVRS